MSEPDLTFLVGRDDETLLHAAQIWAEATSTRDREREVAPVELARPLIEQALGEDRRSFLLVAACPEGPLGFAAVAPDEQHPEIAKLRYLGVKPTAWGHGAARALLAELARHLVSTGYRRAVLNVYPDNVRAVRLYERSGWRAVGGLGRNQRSGEAEQCYELTLGELSDGR